MNHSGWGEAPDEPLVSTFFGSRGRSPHQFLFNRLAKAIQRAVPAFFALLLLALPAVVQAQFLYTTNNGTITITGYTGPGGAVTIPDTINGLSVTSVGDFAFAYTSLTNVTIPDSVTSIGGYAFEFCGNLMRVSVPGSVTDFGFVWSFYDCTNLTGLYFRGNAPDYHSIPYFQTNTIIYYLPGSVGWDSFLTSHQLELWLPQAQAGDVSFGVQNNQFGFNINWASGQTVVVEACNNLANPVWQSVQTNTLTGDSVYFSDPQWTNYPTRLYRLRSP
jgi:hypothetical protein